VTGGDARSAEASTVMRLGDCLPRQVVQVRQVDDSFGARGRCSGVSLEDHEACDEEKRGGNQGWERESSLLAVSEEREVSFVEVQEQGSTLRYEHSWKVKMVINGFGAGCTAIVALVFAATKFRDGAWVVLVLIPVLVLIFLSIHRGSSNHVRSCGNWILLISWVPPL